MGQFGARAQSGRLAAWAVALAFALLLPLLPSPAAPAARAQHGGILLPFEAASFLLLVAAVGAVVLARRRRGLEDAPVSTGPTGRRDEPPPTETLEVRV